MKQSKELSREQVKAVVSLSDSVARQYPCTAEYLLDSAGGHCLNCGARLKPHDLADRYCNECFPSGAELSL